MTPKPATAEPEDWEDVLVVPDISDIRIEDDEPLDNIYSEKQQRLLTEPLFASWTAPPEHGEPVPFVAMANVGVFGALRRNPLVPDVLLSTGVEVNDALLDEKRHRTYFIWEMGTAPDVVVEIVSNRRGGELTTRRSGYARLGVPYYVVWDPAQHLGDRELSVFELAGGKYRRLERAEFPSLGLSLEPWDGRFEGVTTRWLRWRSQGELLPTGAERADLEAGRADKEAARAEQERERAEQERARAEQERARADRLVALLRAAGIDPDA